MGNPDEEIMLAQEQSVTEKTSFNDEVQGTLILTNKRLLFVAGNEEEDDLGGGVLGKLFPIRLRFSDIDDLAEIPGNPSNLSIPLGEIEVEQGHEGIIRHPSLVVKWKEGSLEKKTVFVSDIADGSRKKGLKAWAGVIDMLKNGTLTIQYPKAPAPKKDTLEGKILFVLGDMQEKGVFEIEEQVEKVFNVDLDPDEVEAACQKLVSLGFADAMNDKGLLNRMSETTDISFYRKKSPLGADDLSS